MTRLTAAEFQRYFGGTLFTDGDIVLLNRRYVDGGEPLDDLAGTIGKSARTLTRYFRENELPERKRGPAKGH